MTQLLRFFIRQVRLFLSKRTWIFYVNVLVIGFVFAQMRGFGIYPPLIISLLWLMISLSFPTRARSRRQHRRRRHVRVVEIPDRIPREYIFDDNPFYDKGEVPATVYQDMPQEQFLHAPDGERLRVIRHEEEAD